MSGVVLAVTLDGIPAGITVSAPTTTITNGTLQLQPDNGGDVVSAGTPITFFYPVVGSDTTFVQNVTIPYTLSLPGGANSMPPVGSPITMTVTAKVTPITANDGVIVRFAANQVGPTPFASIVNCRTGRIPQIISE